MMCALILMGQLWINPCQIVRLAEVGPTNCLIFLVNTGRPVQMNQSCKTTALEITAKRKLNDE